MVVNIMLTYVISSSLSNFLDACLPRPLVLEDPLPFPTDGDRSSPSESLIITVVKTSQYRVCETLLVSHIATWFRFLGGSCRIGSAFRRRHNCRQRCRSRWQLRWSGEDGSKSTKRTRVTCFEKSVNLNLFTLLCYIDDNPSASLSWKWSQQ